MTFAQLIYRESLRDIETCLRSVQPKLYHLGFRGRIARSTIADANRNRDWRIYADFAQMLIVHARKLYADEPFGVDLKGAVYALDSTVIDLCLSPFSRASLRRIRYYDADLDKRFVFLTNNFALPAMTITQLYKCCWQIELFFKWIKQHLRIKTFYGTSPNAVRTQVWIAISVYVLVAIVKKELRIDRSLYEILQILSVNPFEKTPTFQLF